LSKQDILKVQILIENEDLKQEIKNLKDVNKELTQKINIIEYENKELKDRIIILENENIQLKFNNFKNKLLTAIQDINKNDNLEKKYNYLHKIRKYRNNNNHYINEEFDIDNNVINGYVYY
jgi:predicted nuclease with TOPRIM domain